jgi:hypothetical protein
MNAVSFRHFYDYHFTEIRKIWNRDITPLSQEQLTLIAMPYSARWHVKKRIKKTSPPYSGNKRAAPDRSCQALPFYFLCQI